MQANANSTPAAAALGRAASWTRRLPLTVSVAGAAGLALWAHGPHVPRTWLAASGSLLVGSVAARSESRIGRALAWGAAMALASLGSSREDRALEVCGAMGAMTCAAAAATAMTRVPAAGGMHRSAPSSPVGPAVAIAALWLTALVASLARGAGDAWPAGAWTVLAATGTLLVLWTQAEWILRRRRLEMGIVERALAIRCLLGTALLLSVVAGMVGSPGMTSPVRAAAAVAAALTGHAALHRDAVEVARITRRVVALGVIGAAAALLGTALASAGVDAWVAMLWTAGVALAGVALVPAIEAPLRPARGVWLDAFAQAGAAASRPDAEDAIRDALMALRTPGGLSSPSPELWTPSPSQWMSVDAAGYLHTRDADLPEALFAAGAAEPEGVVRADLLSALEVRRPDLRALAQWLNDRGAMLAVVIASEGEVEGVLLLPRVAREDPPTLEELRALRLVADRLAAPCRARSTHRRLLSRGDAAHLRAAAAEEKMERLEHQRALDAGRDALATTRLARAARVGIYAAGSRLAFEALERRSSAGAPLVVVAPSGVDPVPYLARAHLAGARRDGPLVLVDATSSHEHELARWADPRASPLALADRGMLVLLDVGALPGEVQQAIGRALAERRAPWPRAEPLDVQLAVTSQVAPEELVRQARLDPSLALRLGDGRGAPVTLPRLRDRLEDLRAIITDRLAREGMRARGRPVGIEAAAYARLIEHPFPGEDAELAVVLQRLVARSVDDVVRASDVDALRLSAASPGVRRDGSGRPRKGPLSA